MAAALRKFALLALLASAAGPALAAEWRVERVPVKGRVTAISQIGNDVRIEIGGKWLRPFVDGKRITLAPVGPPDQAKPPHGALPDGRVVTGANDISRAWLAEPTTRYGHGVLGDAIEAASLVMEFRAGGRAMVRLPSDSVFEDLIPRLADLDRDGKDEIVLVKSYLDRGASLAIVKQRYEKHTIVFETPPIGQANRWLNPAGIADFDGDGAIDIAFVRMPHVLGMLELWSWRDGRLHKMLELDDVTNHVIGSRALEMSAVADFDGDGIADLAIPSRDRRSIRIIGFTPALRDIARLKLPAPAQDNVALLRDPLRRPVVLVGLSNGALVAVRAR